MSACSPQRVAVLILGHVKRSCHQDLTNIILTDVHTLYARRQSNIDTIIDEQWYALRLGHGMELLGYAYQILGVTCLVAKLNNCGAYIDNDQIM